MNPKHLRSLLAFGLLLTGLVLINHIAQRLPGQWDTTEDKNYTLSPGSRALLKKLEEPVIIEFYYTRSVEGLPVYFKNFADRVEELLRQYDRHGRGAIDLRVINPRPDTREEEAAIRAGLSRQSLPNGEVVVLGVNVIQGEKELQIPFVQPDREPFLEYDISRLIHEATVLFRPRLGVLTMLPMQGERPRFTQSPAGASGQPWLILQELQRTYDVTFLDPRNPAGWGDLDILAAIHPPALNESARYAIDQHLLGGRPALFAVDPSSAVMRAINAGQSGMSMLGQADSLISGSNMEAFFRHWGITFRGDQVVGDLDGALTVNAGARGQSIVNPVYMAIDVVSDDNPALAQLSSIWMIEGGSFDASAQSSLRWRPLLSTSKRSGEILAGSLAVIPPQDLVRQIFPDSIQRSLAGILSGEANSLFPEGNPSKGPASETSDSHINSGNIRVALVADTDFIFDDYAVQRMNLFGMESYQPLNDNLAFFVNLIDTLAGSEDLVSIRGKGNTQRSFKRIEAMEREAQEAFRSAREAIEMRITETSRQLTQLQSQQDDGSRLVASPEVLEAIEALRREEADFRQRLREIRKNMREDIEALEFRLAALNLLISPLLITLAGIAFFSLRNRRRS